MNVLLQFNKSVEYFYRYISNTINNKKGKITKNGNIIQLKFIIGKKQIYFYIYYLSGLP